MTSPARSDDVQATEEAADVSPIETSGERPGADVPGGPREIGGRDGLDPTRYGDWELRGRCIDF